MLAVTHGLLLATALCHCVSRLLVLVVAVGVGGGISTPRRNSSVLVVPPLLVTRRAAGGMPWLIALTRGGDMSFSSGVSGGLPKGDGERS